VEIEKVGEPQHVVSERLLTIPNVLSILRLLGVPVFLWAILSGRDGLALLLLLFSGVTDYLDGKIARQFNMESRLGGFLDPIADRLYILATLFGLMWRDIIPVWLVVVLLARELVMAMMLLYLRSRGQVGLPVHFVGKAATFNLLYAFPLLLLAHRDDWIGDLARPIGWGFAWWGVVLYWLAAVLYAVHARIVLTQGSRAVTP
jgi:cardiolipin synthase